METFYNNVLARLTETNIKEVAEDSKYITIKFELKFNDGSTFVHDCFIKKSMITVGNINGMVL